MQVEIIVGQPITFWAAVVSETTGVALELDEIACIGIAKNGVELTFPDDANVDIGSFVEDFGYFVTIMPTVASVSGDNFNVVMEADNGGDVTQESYEGIAVFDAAEIVSLVATKVINVNSPVSRSGTQIDIIRGAAYDGTHHGKFRWTVDKDYQTGWTMHLRVYLKGSGEEAEPIMAIEGAAESATSIAATALQADTQWADIGDEAYNDRHDFEVAMEKDGEWEVIIPNGVAVLYRGRIPSSE